jgi:thiol peroxidase
MNSTHLVSPRGAPRRRLPAALVLLAPLVLAALSPAAARGQIRDNAALFSPAAEQEATRAVEQIRQRFGRTLLIETYRAVPPDRQADLRRLGPDRFFQEWVAARGKAESVNGVILLISMDPKRVQMAVANETTRSGLFTPEDRAAVLPRLVEAMRAGRHDEVATTAATAVLERMAANHARLAATRPAANPASAPVAPATQPGTPATQPATPATQPVAAATPAMSPVTQPAERKGLVAVRGNPLTLVGTPVAVGDEAPAFTAVANDMTPFAFDPAAADKAGKVWVLSAVPSLDTPTCSTETKRFNEEADKLGEGVSVLTVSMDLPFAQKRWCGAEGVKRVQTVSDFKDRAFGERYGVKIKENGLLARAVFVVGKDGRVAYAQLVPELSKEPDYDAVLAAAKAAAAK